MEILLRHMMAAAAPTVAWWAWFFAAVVAVFVLYVGIAMVVVLRTGDVRTAEIRYRVFRDLLRLFRPRGRR